ncbi:hypothetical protein D3C71_1402420 [compost metagenome]
MGDHHLHRLRENSGRIAGVSAKRNSAEQTVQTRCLSRQKRIADAIAGNASSVNPGDALLLGDVVQNEPCIKVIRCVHDQIHAFGQLLQLFSAYIQDMAFYNYIGVDGRQARLRRRRFGRPVGRILFRVQRLPLQIAPLDIIAVDDDHPSRTAAYERLGHACPKRARSNDEHCRIRELALAFLAEGGKSNLTGIPSVFAAGYDSGLFSICYSLHPDPPPNSRINAIRRLLGAERLPRNRRPLISNNLYSLIF